MVLPNKVTRTRMDVDKMIELDEIERELNKTSVWGKKKTSRKHPLSP